MKTLRSYLFGLLALLTVLVISPYESYGYNDHCKDSYLSVHGNILNNKKEVSIYVFTYVDSLEKWVNTLSIEKKHKYSIRLNPSEHHQVWFTNHDGTVKKLFVEAGDTVIYDQWLDVDFSNKKSAVIYQHYQYNYLIVSLENKSIYHIPWDAGPTEYPWHYEGNDLILAYRDDSIPLEELENK